MCHLLLFSDLKTWFGWKKLLLTSQNESKEIEKDFAVKGK